MRKFLSCSVMIVVEDWRGPLLLVFRGSSKSMVSAYADTTLCCVSKYNRRCERKITSKLSRRAK